jgi:hypothetical protein
MNDIEPCLLMGDGLALSLEMLSPPLRRRFEVAASIREHAVPGAARTAAEAEFKEVADDVKLELASFVALRRAPRAVLGR